MTLLSIGAVAQRFGMRPSALRYYEALGLVPPTVLRGRMRLYSGEAVERLGLVRLLVEAGLSLEAIGEVLNGARSWRVALQEADARLAKRLQDFQRAREQVAYLLSCPREDPREGCPVLPGLVAPRR